MSTLYQAMKQMEKLYKLSKKHFEQPEWAALFASGIARSPLAYHRDIKSIIGEQYQAALEISESGVSRTDMRSMNSDEVVAHLGFARSALGKRLDSVEHAYLMSEQLDKIPEIGARLSIGLCSLRTVNMETARGQMEAGYHTAYGYAGQDDKDAAIVASAMAMFGFGENELEQVYGELGILIPRPKVDPYALFAYCSSRMSGDSNNIGVVLNLARKVADDDKETAKIAVGLVRLIET